MISIAASRSAILLRQSVVWKAGGALCPWHTMCPAVLTQWAERMADSLESYHEIGHLFAFIHHGIRVDSCEVGEGWGRTRLLSQDVEAIHAPVSVSGQRAGILRAF